MGVCQGKKMIIDALKECYVDFNKLMEIHPEEITNYDIKHTFISDIKEALFK